MAVIASLDQLTKALVLANFEPHVAYPVIGDWARLYLLFNSGAAFSIGEGHTWIFTLIQLGFVAGALWYSPKVRTAWVAAGCAMVAGGALGNLIDRLLRAPGFFVGHVVDFISVGSFAVFNLADSAITCGVVVLLIGLIKEEKMMGKEEQRA